MPAPTPIFAHSVQRHLKGILSACEVQGRADPADEFPAQLREFAARWLARLDERRLRPRP